MISRAAAARRGLLVPAAVVALVGCGTADDPRAQGPYTPPGWMAEQAQRAAEYREGLQTCVAGKGWDVTVLDGGAVAEPFTDSEFARWQVDRDDCRAEMGIADPGALTRARAEQLYARQVDTWRCVRDLGHDVPAPPSEPAYVDELLGEGGVTEWGPYGDLAGVLTEAEMRAVTETCPEPWWAD